MMNVLCITGYSLFNLQFIIDRFANFLLDLDVEIKQQAEHYGHLTKHRMPLIHSDIRCLDRFIHDAPHFSPGTGSP